MQVRECTAADVDVLERLDPTGASRRHLRAYERQLSGTCTVLLAVDERGVPVGRVEVRWDGSDDPDVRAAHPGCPELNNLNVLPHRRGQGIGTTLVRAVEERCRERGLRQVGLGVADDNPRAAALYARLGYRGGLRYVDVWSWVGADGVEHRVGDPCTYLTRELG